MKFFVFMVFTVLFANNAFASSEIYCGVTRLTGNVLAGDQTGEILYRGMVPQPSVLFVDAQNKVVVGSLKNIMPSMPDLEYFVVLAMGDTMAILDKNGTVGTGGKDNVGLASARTRLMVSCVR